MKLVPIAVLVVVVAFLSGFLRRWISYLRRARRMDQLTAKLPQLPGYPIIGSALEFVGCADDLIGHILSKETLFSPDATLGKGWLGPLMFITMREPEDVQVVLTSPHFATKPAVPHKSLEPALGRGLSSLNGSEHKRHRKIIAASMHLEILQDFVVTFNAKSRDLVSRLDRLATTGEVFDVSPELGWCSIHTVCGTVLGTEAPGLEAEKAAFVEALHSGSRVVAYRAAKPWYNSDLIFWLMDRTVYHEYKKIIHIIASFCDKVLAQKLQALEKANSESTKGTEGSPAPKPSRQSFLDQLLAPPDASVLSLDELRQELQTMLVLGAATSMDFLSFFLTCMALLPEEQRRVQKELDDVFGSEVTRDVLASDLPHMEYMECVFKETLRFFPPAPISIRQATQDVELPSGQVLPEDCSVIILPTLVHRNPRHFPDPLTFSPERFSTECSKDRHPYAFIPFSAGPRNCIGQRYAILFAKTVAASVLRRFDVLSDPEGPQRIQDVPTIGGISLSIKGGARIRLRLRGETSQARG